MPESDRDRILTTLTERGYNADREAVSLLMEREDPVAATEAVLAGLSSEALVVDGAAVRTHLEEASTVSGAAADVPRGGSSAGRDGSQAGFESTADGGDRAASTVDAERPGAPVSSPDPEADARPVADADARSDSDAGSRPTATADARPDGRSTGDPLATPRRDGANGVRIHADMTGESTTTGEYRDFLSLFRDRLERLGGIVENRVSPIPARAAGERSPGSTIEMVGLVSDVRSTSGGHTLVELEDASGVFPWLLLSDRDVADVAPEIVHDEVLGMRGTLADDAGIAFAESVHLPDVPRTFEPSTADRPVEAALVSDLHVGSEEFAAAAWEAFAEWLHTPEAESVEYLLVAGDLVEGVGVYPDQDEELEIVDVFAQYERFGEYCKALPGDLEIVLVPGNHDAVRLAEPQPGFDETIRDAMTAHETRIASNPAVVEVEGVSILLYHGTSLDELIAALPEDRGSYEAPERAMAQQLRKRHLAPPFGGMQRLAPERRDHLVIGEIPDVFHAGHVHKLGVGNYRNVRIVNSACWQHQTVFQRSVNLEPDVGFAPIVDLETLEVTVRSF